MTKQYLSRILLTISLSLGLHAVAAAMSYDSTEGVLPAQEACVTYSFMTPGTSSMSLPGLSTATSTGSRVNANDVLNRIPEIFNGSGKGHKHKSSKTSKSKRERTSSSSSGDRQDAKNHAKVWKKHGGHGRRDGQPDYGNKHKLDKKTSNGSTMTLPANQPNRGSNQGIYNKPEGGTFNPSANQPVWKPGQSGNVTVTLPSNQPDRGNKQGVYKPNDNKPDWGNNKSHDKKPDWGNNKSHDKKPDWSSNKSHGKRPEWDNNNSNGNNHAWKNRPGDTRGQNKVQLPDNSKGKTGGERVHGAHWCYGACSLHDQGYHSAPRTQKHWCDGYRHYQ